MAVHHYYYCKIAITMKLSEFYNASSWNENLFVKKYIWICPKYFCIFFWKKINQEIPRLDHILLIDELKKSVEWKIHLTKNVTFLLLKNFADKRLIHSKSNTREIIIGNNEIIKELLQSLLSMIKYIKKHQWKIVFLSLIVFMES